MIDQFSIFHRGGGVLWERTLPSMSVPSPSQPVDSLIRSVLLEERAASTHFRHERYTVKWTFANELELVFVAVYLNVANLLYIDQLLDRVKDSFVALVKPQWAEARKAYRLPPSVKFDRRFDRIVAEFELNSLASRKGPRSFEEANKVAGASSGSSGKASSGGSSGGSKTQRAAGDADGGTYGDDESGAARSGEVGSTGSADGVGERSGGSSAVTDSESAVGGGGSGGFNADKLRAMQQRGSRPMRAGPPSKKKSKEGKDTPSKDGAEEDGKKKRVKQATKCTRPQHTIGTHSLDAPMCGAADRLLTSLRVLPHDRCACSQGTKRTPHPQHTWPAPELRLSGGAYCVACCAAPLTLRCCAVVHARQG